MLAVVFALSGCSFADEVKPESDASESWSWQDAFTIEQVVLAEEGLDWLAEFDAEYGAIVEAGVATPEALAYFQKTVVDPDAAWRWLHQSQAEQRIELRRPGWVVSTQPYKVLVEDDGTVEVHINRCLDPTKIDVVVAGQLQPVAEDAATRQSIMLKRLPDGSWRYSGYSTHSPNLCP